MAYDGGDERGLPLWDERVLDLGAPSCMDTATFIEWLERQLETPDDTEDRVEALAKRHVRWHEKTPGIWSCCVFGRIPFPTTNEIRSMNA